MSLRAPVVDRALDLPPLYSLVVLREAGDAFAHACAIAGEQDAGTLIWVRRYDAAEFAVVLEPEEPFAHARLAFYAAMNALADALAMHAPPSRPITFAWPDTICVDGVHVGGGRLGWPKGTRDGQTPAWLVFSAMIRTTVVGDDEPGLRPLLGALDEVGFETPDPGEIIASFSRHLMSAFHRWGKIGFAPVARQWLERFPTTGPDVRLADNGDLLLSAEPSQKGPRRQSLAKALASPTWLDPATGMPWL
ncbi:MAG: biotin/lipoate--protein ligase family protein [Rhizobiaceae bacterium]|nr:biotin/lipoate--protein ligase family protein [Rhizobiaceae bacterium]MCV0407966.1 biotin/lipoate--protein ligase family protein [Rhizobiaceae bacterium]